MDYQIIDAPQGSEAWLQARKDCNTASEAPAALGVSKYQTRDELLLQKKTGLTKEVNAATQKLFDRGHETESLARVLAEEIIGEELYPITAKREVEGMQLLASMDGLTMLGDVGFEHKLVSQDLIEQIKAKSLEPHYSLQMDQQILVTGARKILFMASDGTKENCHWMWYESTKAKETFLLAGWEQFERDLESFVPVIVPEKVIVEDIKPLPTISVAISAQVLDTNVQTVFEAHQNFITNIKPASELETDEDFAYGEKLVKFSADFEGYCQAAEDNALSQATSVNDFIQTVRTMRESTRQIRLDYKKALDVKKEAVKTNAILQAKQAYNEYLNELQKDCVVMLNLVLPQPDFAGAIKGVKTIASMHSRINDALAAGKAQAKQFADEVRTKVEFIKASIEGYAHLINIADLATKDLDFIKLHIQSVKDAEDKRKAEHEAAIKAKAEAEARAKVEAEQRAKEQAEAKQINEAKPAEVKADTLPAKDDAVSLAIPKEITEKAQEHRYASSPLYPLWKHMFDEHGLSLLDSEVIEIIRVAVLVNDKLHQNADLFQEAA